MYKADLDKNRKLVFVELLDEFTVDQAYEATKDFWTKLASIGKNGYIICDLSKFKNGTRGASVILQRIMKLVDSYDPTAVIRVINGYSGSMQFDRAYGAVGAEYKVCRVGTVKEAYEIVDSVSEIPCVFNKPPLKN